MLWLFENWDKVAALIVALIPFVLATKWGKANKEALFWLADRVEHRDGLIPVKEGMKADVKYLQPSVQDALKAVADVVDIKKTPESRGRKALRVVKRLALGLVLRRLG